MLCGKIQHRKLIFQSRERKRRSEMEKYSSATSSNQHCTSPRYESFHIYLFPLFYSLWLSYCAKRFYKPFKVRHLGWVLCAFLLVICTNCVQGEMCSETKECPQNCTCEMGTCDFKTYSIRCCNKATCSNISSIPKEDEFAKFVYWMHLDNNTISSIPNFGNLRKYLRGLYLSNNSLGETSYLQFQALTKLVHLNLSHNLIEVVQPQSFQDLLQLKQLDLGYNKIKSLSPEIFKPLQQLEILLLSGNHFTTLSFLPLQNFKVPLSLHLKDNPWLCNCGIEWMKNETFLTTYGITIQDISQTMCDKPSVIRVQLADLDNLRCAQSYLSCAYPKNKEPEIVVWEFTDLDESVKHNDKSCNELCFRNNYHYATVRDEDQSCLCASNMTSQHLLNSAKNEWKECQQACGDSIVERRCGREVLQDNVLRVNYHVTFTGLRTFSQQEEATVTVHIKPKIGLNFMWNFNDTTPFEVVTGSDVFTVRHKYVTPGIYKVSVTVRVDDEKLSDIYPVQTFGLVIIVEMPISKFQVDCPASVYSTDLDQSQVNLNITSGTKSRGEWKIKLKTKTTDWYQPPTGSQYFETSGLYYLVHNQKRSRSNAQTECQKQNGYLVDIYNSQVQQFLTSLPLQNSGTYWTGIVDWFSEDSYMQLDYVVKSATYKNWAPGQPDDNPNICSKSQVKKDCVYMDAATGKWFDDNCNATHSFICQYSRDYKLNLFNDPKHLISGAVFFSKAVASVANISRDNSGTFFSNTFVLLLPEFFIHESGILNSWEFIDQGASSRLHLQIFEAECNQEEYPFIIFPGCQNMTTNKAVCAKQACHKEYSSANCPNEFHFCSITNKCQAITSPCKTSQMPQFDHVDPSYKLIRKFITSTIGLPNGLNQKFISVTRVSQHTNENNELIIVDYIGMLILTNDDKLLLEKNQVIGVSFELKDELEEISETDIPILCETSDYGVWMQDAVVYSVDGWLNEQSFLQPTYNKKIFASAWCNIRLQYSQPSLTEIKLSSILNSELVGKQWIEFYVKNDVSQPPIQTCEIEILDVIKSVTVVNFKVNKLQQLRSTSEDKVDGEISVPLGKSFPITVKVDGNSQSKVNFSTSEGESQQAVVEKVCSESNECEYQASSDLIVNNKDGTVIKVSAYNEAMAKTLRLRARTFTPIQDLAIFPTHVDRILVGVPQTFEGNVSSGSGITYTWKVDGLTQFQHVGQVFHILFRLPGTYTINLEAKNSANTESTSRSINVDEINPMVNLAFVNPELVIKKGDSKEFTVEVEVDELADMTVIWKLNGAVLETNIFEQPHLGTRQQADIERVKLSLSHNIVFNTESEDQIIRIEASTEYDDSISVEHVVNVRDVLKPIQCTVNSESSSSIKVAKDVETQFNLLGNQYSENTFDWGDGTANHVSEGKEVSHVFNTLGIYTVQITSDNGISTEKVNKEIKVYNEITEVNLYCENGICVREFMYPIKVFATLQADYADLSPDMVQYTFKWNAGEVFEAADVNSAEFTYLTIGGKEVEVTATNAFNSKSQTLSLTIFEVKLVSVSQKELCSKTGDVEIEATMPVTDYQLFTFKVGFEGVEQNFDGISGNVFTHRYDSAAIYNESFKVISKESGASDSMNFQVCVEDPIISVSITSVTHAETNTEVTFSITIMGGTDVTYDIKFETTGIPANYAGSVTQQMHTYLSPGTYDVSIEAFNQVDRKIETIQVVVQDKIVGVTITHDSSYGQAVIATNSVYTFTCGISAGTDVAYTWDFYNGVTKTGKSVTHSYTVTGEFTVSVTASNQINSETATIKVQVKEAISITDLTQSSDYIKVGEKVQFDVTYPAQPGTTNVYWEIDPGYSRTAGASPFYFTFTAVDNYTITVTVENEVSSETRQVIVLCGMEIPDLKITSDDFLNNDFVSTGVSTFYASLNDGSSINTTTAGVDSKITYTWELKYAGTAQETSTDGPYATFTIANPGRYELTLEVSNGLNTKGTSHVITAVKPMTTLTFTKDDPQGAAETGVSFTIESNTDGSHYTCDWDDSINPMVTMVNFTHTYTTAGTYTLSITCTNLLGSLTENYGIVIEDSVTGLQMAHNGSLSGWVFATGILVGFSSATTSGTQLQFCWKIKDSANVVLASANGGTFSHTFTTAGIYTITLEANNQISSNEIIESIEILQAIEGLQILSSSFIVETNKQFQFTGSITKGTDAVFDFLVTALSMSINPITIDPFNANGSWTFTNHGNYEIKATVSNKISSEVESVNFIVRDAIVNAGIGGCCNQGDYLKTGTNYEFDLTGVTVGMQANATWSATYADGTQISQTTGPIYTVSFPNPGNVTIKLVVDNDISLNENEMLLHIQMAPHVKINVVEIGRSYFTQDTVVLNIDTILGTDIQHEVNFGDGSPLITTTDSSADHIYKVNNTYTITVKSINEVGEDLNTETVEILKLECAPPSLSFVTTYTIYPRSSRFLFEAKLDSNNCSTYVINYQWTIYRQDDCAITPSSVEETFLMYDNKPIIIIPALSLDVRKYCFVAEVAYEDTYLTDNNFVVIEITASDPVAIIDGGTERTVKKGDYLLNGEYSFDPDIPETLPQNLKYRWSCLYRDAGSASLTNPIMPNFTACAFAIPDAVQYTIAENLLEADKEYLFTLTVVKDNSLHESTSQSVIMLALQVPEVSISCASCIQHSSLQITSTRHVTLVGRYGGYQTVAFSEEYKWTVTLTNVNNGPTASASLSADDTTTGLRSKNLVVKEGVIQPNYQYKFGLTVIINNVEEGLSELNLYPNNPPTSGTCTLSYPSETINVLEDLVKFECSDWFDEDSPLIYSVLAFRNDGSHRDIFVLYRGSSSSYETYLPLGAPDLYSVKIEIIVEDQYGSSTVGYETSLTVVLDVPEDQTIPYMQEKVNGELYALQRMNNLQDISCFATSLATTLNKQSADAEYKVQNDNRYPDRKSLREQITSVVVSIQTSTMEEVEQLASVLEQAVAVPNEMQDETTFQSALDKVKNMIDVMVNDDQNTGQGTIEHVSSNLININSHLLAATNFNYYQPTASAVLSQIYGISYSEINRQQTVNTIMESVDLVVKNTLQRKVVEEEPLTTITDSMSIWYTKTTPSLLERKIANDGCTFEIPESLFCTMEDDDEIFMSMYTFEQNIYTFGMPRLLENDDTQVTSRVTSLTFANTNGSDIIVNSVNSNKCDTTARERESDTSNGFCGTDMFRLTLARNDLSFLSVDETLQLSRLEGPYYDPKYGLNFTDQFLNKKESVAMTINNKNDDPLTAIYIMVTYTKTYTGDSDPDVLVMLGTAGTPTINNYTQKMELSDEIIQGSNHLQYTMYLDPIVVDTTLPFYYLNISNNFEQHSITVQVAVYYSSCQYLDQETNLWSTSGIFPSPETTVTLAVCCSSHLTSFGSFTINPPNIISITEIKNIDFAKSVVALALVVILCVLSIIAMIWSRKLDIRDIKKSSLIPLCGPNGSFKYEITIKTSAGMGSGTTANVGVCLYGYDSKSRSRHLYKKNGFQRGNVDSFQIACDVDLGQLYKIKIWHDNTGLDPAWCVERIFVKDLQSGEKYYFLVDAWMQVYPDDDDEDCLQKTIPVASEEELNDFSHLFGTQLAYGWEDAHLWLSVFEKPSQSRFTRVQRVTCCATLIFTFLVCSAFWYQGFDENGEVTSDDNKIGVLRWKDIAVGAIVSILVFPINMIIIVIFKKSKSKVSPVKPWPERTQTAQTIEILDEVIDGRGKKLRRFSMQDNISELGEYFNTKNHLPGQSQFLAELDIGGSESVMFTRTPTLLSNNKKKPISQQLNSRLHKTSGTVKSLELRDRVWDSEDSAVQLSESPVSSESFPSENGSDEHLIKSNTNRPVVGEAWAKSAKGKRSEPQFDGVDKNIDIARLESRQSVASAKPNKAQLRRRNTAYVRRDIDSATPPNFNQDDLDEDDDFWNMFPDETSVDTSFIDLPNKGANLKRTRVTKFTEDDLPICDNDGLPDFDSDEFGSEYEDLDDVPLPEMPPTRDGQSFPSRASSIIGTSPQMNNEGCLLPHWCIYLNYVVCILTIAVCIIYIIIYGNAFGPITTLRWFLCTIIAILESFFIIEPAKVILLAIFVAMITKPLNPDGNDNLVEEPFVETYEHVKNTRVRPPGGFGLQQCKVQAKKAKRLQKVLVNLSLYLLLLTSAAAVASWDKDSHAIYMTQSMKDGFFNENFLTTISEEGLTENITFQQIRKLSQMHDWMNKVFAVKMFDSDDKSLDNENVNNVLFGSVRIRQQRTEYVTCPVNTKQKRAYEELVEADYKCLTTDQSRQVTTSYIYGLLQNETQNYIPAQVSAVMYSGENHLYDDGGYAHYLPTNNTVVETQLAVNRLFANNWIDRQTSVVFVEFTLYNPANLWFIVSVAIFEIGVTGSVTPSHDVNVVRLFVPSAGLYVDMIFMSILGLVILFLLFKELRKISNKKITGKIYFTKYTNYLNLLVIGVGITLCTLYVYKQVYMEEVMQAYIANKQDFTNFYKLAFYTNLVTYTASLLLAVIMFRAFRIFRFIRWWSKFGLTLSEAAVKLFFASIIMITLILTYAVLGFLIYGQNYTNTVTDFQDFPNSIYAMFRAFRGTLTFDDCFDASPVFSTIFFLSFYIGVFYIVGSLFAAILIDEYKYAVLQVKQPLYTVPDYETLDYFITRVKMRLGIIKPKQFRPTVRFEDMSAPSSRGSFISLDSFDTYFNPGRISQFSNASGFSSSSSDSGLGTPSDHSISIFDYLQHEPPTDRPLDPLHLDYLYDRLSSYSVDMLLRRFERVNELGEEVLGLESNLLAVTDHIKQKKKMQEQSHEIALAASSTTIRSKFSPASKQSSDDGSSNQFGSMPSHVGRSMSSLKSRSRSELSGDTMLQTVIDSIFPIEETNRQQRSPYRSSSYAGPPVSEKDLAAYNVKQSSIYDDVVLKSAQSSRSTESEKPAIKKQKATKQRPHSDEGQRITTKSLIEQAQNSRRSLNNVDKVTREKPKPKTKPKSNLNPLTKRSAWLL